MSFLNRMVDYQKNFRNKFPSGPSHLPHQQQHSGMQKHETWRDRYPEYKGGVYHREDDEETILEGKVKISLDRGDLLVIPVGRIEEVPDKYKSRVVEVPHLFDFAVIS